MPPPALSRRQAWFVALVATLTMAVSYADRQALAVLAPTVTRALSMSEQTYGWLLSAFSLAYMLGAPLAGRWIDRVGARRGLVASVLIWSAVAALHALVPGVAVLFVLRIALGLAESPSFPGAAQTVQRVLPVTDRPRGFGVLFVGSSLGAMVVPPLTSWLTAKFGFRMALFGTALIGLTWLPLWLRATRPNAVRALLDRPAAAPRQTTPLTTLLRHRAVLRGLCVILAASPMMSYALNWSSKYLVAAFALPQREIGHFLWLPPLLYDLGSIGFGHFASRRLLRATGEAPPPRLLLGCALLLALTVTLIPLAPSPWLSVVLIGLAMAGGGGLFALVTADMLARVPQHAVSAVSGLSAAGQSVAYIVASPLIGWGIEHVTHVGVVHGLGLWLLPGCIAWLLWTPPSRSPT